MSELSIPLIVLWLVVGAATGGVYFLLLRRSVDKLANGAPISAAVGWFALRIAVAGAVFWGAAQYGTAAILSALLGFMIARVMIQRRVEAA